MILLPLKRANDASESLICMRTWSSRNFMTSQTCKRRKHTLTFLVFPSVNFVKVCILHDIDAYFTISFFDKMLSKERKGNCTIFKNPLVKFFIFSNLSIVRDRFYKIAKFQDIFNSGKGTMQIGGK